MDGAGAVHLGEVHDGVWGLVRAVLGDVQRSAGALYREVRDNPDGEVARALVGTVSSLECLASSVSDADSYASGVHPAPDNPLPDPVAAARGE